jgi:hypothetical protein
VDVPRTLKTEYGTRVVTPGSWADEELSQLLGAIEDLAAFLGGPAPFRGKLGRVFLWRTARRTSMAAMAMPLIDVVYFRGASWGDAPELSGRQCTNWPTCGISTPSTGCPGG